VRALLLMVSGLVIGLGAGTSWLLGSGHFALTGHLLVGGVLVAGGTAAGGAALVGRSRLAVLALAATFVTFNYVLVLHVLPELERLKPVVPMAQIFRRHAGSEAQIGFYQLTLPSLVYYVDQPVRDLATHDEAAAFFKDGTDRWALMSQVSWHDLRDRGVPLCIADRRPLFDAKLRDLLARSPPPDVLLVTNRCELPATSR
jgi:hypothetical protein